MWGRRLFLDGFKLPSHFLLPLEQCRHLQLQTLDDSLLLHQHIIQRLDGVILKCQASFQIGNTRLKIHGSTLHKLEIIGQGHP
ncbi:hypothetical protein SAMN04490183_0334 [Pseudomonas corrugata]|nr:hypothetical protein SAMN04490183_0334 [Pseudomonas corrugata]